MKSSSSGFTKFITFSFIAHILISFFLVFYAQDYQQKQKELEEIKKAEDTLKEEEELKADIKEVLSEVIEEKDEKKKEEKIEELKDKVWEELKKDKEELLAEKKDLDQEKYLEKLAEKALDTIEELKKKEEAEEKKKELIDELIAKDLPAIDKKIEEEVKNKTVEELENEALKDSLNDLKKIAEEQIKPVLEKSNEGYLKKIEELIKQIADTTKQADKTSLQDEMKKILEKTDEIVGKAEEVEKKFEEASADFKKDQLDVALDVFKDKEAAVEEKKEAVMEAFQKLTESERTKANLSKLPETEKEWDKAIQQVTDSAKKDENKKPENQSLLTKPLEELAKVDAEKDKAEKVLKEVMKEELTDAKKAAAEIKQVVTSENASKQVAALEKKLDDAAEKTNSKFANEFKEAAENIQTVKETLPEIAKNASKNASESTPKEPLDVALNNLKDKEQAVEKKKEDVLNELNKVASDTSKDKPSEIKAPESEKDWKKLIDKTKDGSKETSKEASKEVVKNNDAQKTEAQTPLTKALKELVQKDTEKEKAVSDLKQLEKAQIVEVKKASADLEKSAKKEETKKQVSDVKKNIEKAEKESDSADAKEIKDSAEIIKAAKNVLPEIAKAEKKSEGNPTKKEETQKNNKATKDPEELKASLEIAKVLVEKGIKDLNEIKTGTEVEEKPSTEKIEGRIAKADELLKTLKAAKTEKNEAKFTDEQIKEPKESVEKAHAIVDELKDDIAKEEQAIKKGIESLKKNLSEKEKSENKEALSSLDATEKSIAQAKSLEPKIEALDTAEAKLEDLKSNINEQRKDSLEKSQEQLKKVKDLAKEISEGLKDSKNKKSKDEIASEIKSQAMEDLTNEKAESFEKFLDANDSDNANEQVKEFKEDAKNSVDAAIKDQSDKKEGKDDANKDTTETTSADENKADEGDEAGAEEGAAEDGEKSKGKGKGKGKKGKGKGKGESGEEDENSALAKALASKMEGQGKEGKGKGEGKGKDDGKSDNEKNKFKGDGNGQKLDGGSGKTPIEIAQNILFRTKSFKKTTVTAEDEKRIFTENVNYEAIRIPPVIKFAKPTANGLPLEVREPSAEVFTGPEVAKTKITEKPKNQDRDRVKNEKFTKGNFAAIPYLTEKPVIDGKNNDWHLDKAWVKNDKRIAMAWRTDGLYFFASIRDRTDSFEKASPEEMFATWWRFDSVELWIDMQNSKSDDTNKFDCQQFTFWPALQNIRSAPELYEVLWGKRVTSSSFKERKVPLKNDSRTYIASVEHADHRGYDVEVYIPSDHLLNRDFFKGGQVAGFIYIINHGNLVEDSSLEFYKEGYDGYSNHPSSWGNIQLLGTDAKIDQINFEKKVIQEKIIEASTNLSLQVTDQDSNQDPNVIDKVTVRVKNENDFDGKKSEDTDWEDVLFTETGKNTGVFTGTITLTVAPSKPDDNALCAHAGDTIHVYYNDHIQVAGEYDEKMHMKIKVVAPIIKVAGKTNQ